MLSVYSKFLGRETRFRNGEENLRAEMRYNHVSKSREICTVNSGERGWQETARGTFDGARHWLGLKLLQN